MDNDRPVKQPHPMIRPKRRAVIQKGNGVSYNPTTFAAEHKVANFYVLEDPQELLQLVKPFEMDGRRFITFDTETHPHFPSSHVVPKEIVRRWVGSGKSASPQDFPFCISICDGTSSYTIFDSVDNDFALFRQLAPLFEDPTIEKIAHNAKYDMHMLANAGMRIVGRIHDTVVLAKLANENRNSFALKDLAAKTAGGIVKFEYMVDAYKQMNKVTDYRRIPRELLGEYANGDVWNCYLVFIREYGKAVEDKLVALYNNECEVMMALYAMERYGMRVNEDYEAPLKTDLQTLTDTAEAAIYAEAGRMFNINSGMQLYSVLMDMGVNAGWIGRTDKGNPKLDKFALQKLADVHGVSIVQKILEFRKYEKLLGTYAIGIYAQRDEEYRVHASINQTEATTGRMSITKPALQTLPKKDQRIRTAFIPDDEFVLFFMDLDQIEYRLFAHYCQSKGLIDAITAGHDVHTATAALIFGKPYDEVTGDERFKAKTTNFALIYGQGDAHTSEMLKLSMTETVAFKNNYFAQIPEARPFINTVHAVIKMRGFVKNFYGRRRRLDTDDCYKAPNALIQGCAADYIKHKLVDIYKYLQHNHLRTRLINIVHDELVIAVHRDEMQHVEVLRWLLSDFTAFRCPITAGVERGDPSWGEKAVADDVEFLYPSDKQYLYYDVFDGSVFDIYRED